MQLLLSIFLSVYELVEVSPLFFLLFHHFQPKQTVHLLFLLLSLERERAQHEEYQSRDAADADEGTGERPVAKNPGATIRRFGGN